jgi:hypothetical protein
MSRHRCGDLIHLDAHQLSPTRRPHCVPERSHVPRLKVGVPRRVPGSACHGVPRVGRDSDTPAAHATSRADKGLARGGFREIIGPAGAGGREHGEPYYRCRFPSEYAGATGQHPRTVYLREADVLPSLDAWLLSVFDPKNLDGAVAALAAAQEPDDAAAARAEAARRGVKDCDTRLAKYRSALEAGADPAVVASWIKEVEADRLHAERELASTASVAQPLSEADIRALVTSQRNVLRSLAKATPEQRAAIYGQTMSLRITYHPDEPESVLVEVRPSCAQVRVGGGT